MGKAVVVSTKFVGVDKLTQVVRKMTAATRTFGTKAVAVFNRVERAGRRLRRGLSNAIGKLGLAVGLFAIARAAGSVINTFANFEQANAGLAAVMGKTVEQNSALAADAKRLGSVTAKTATEVVGLQEAFARLGFEEPQILNMTQSTINGAVAMKAELADAAELVGAMVKSFDNFESVDAAKIMDQMTLATQKSALNFEKLQTGLPIVSGAANAAGIPFTKLLALLGKLSDAGIDASSSSTALRNIFLESAKQGHSYEQILENIQKNQSKLTAANDEFGKRGAVSAVILAKNLKLTAELDKTLQGAAGTAEMAANKQLDTLKGSLTLLGSAWEGFILSLEDGTGKFGNFLKIAVRVVTEILSLASGTAKARNELDDAGKKIRDIAEKSMKWLKALKIIIITLASFKLIMLAIRTSVIAYNAIVGIATAAQWLWNAAMTANPIGIVIVAIAALVTGIIYLVTHWDEMTEKLVNDWARISKTFKEEGLGGVFKMWGKDLLIYVLEPLQNLLAIINKITGGRFGGESLKNTIDLRNKLLEESGRGEEVIPLNPDAAIQNSNFERIEQTKNEKVDIQVSAAKGTEAQIIEDTTNKVQLTPTLGWT